MKIAEHISELLIEHDCVIVPDFGGFVCNYAPAGIDPVKHLFEPPAKRILFNKGLTRNDGLLAYHVSGKLKLSYSEALNSIAKEVKRYKEELEKDKRLTLDTIGLLYIDEKGSLLFQQDTKVNYLADSFGLAAFYHSPVENGKAENETKVIPIYNERKKVRAYAAAAVIAALAVSAFSFTLFEKQTNIRFSSFDFFSKREAPQYVFSPSLYKELPKPVIAETTPVPTPVVASALVASTPVPVSVSSSSFSIIVGSFSVKENAETLVSQFGKQNIHVSIVGRNPGGLYMVGYGNFPSHDVAATERDSIRKASIKDAWIKAN
jgi:CCDC81-like prokaryotic HU domain 1/CCDC81-like prokaryotic HU domain 2/SPOR domain